MKKWVEIFNTLKRLFSIPRLIIRGKEFPVPTFKFVKNPTVQISEIKARRFYIVDRAQIKAKEIAQRNEDLAVFCAIRNYGFRRDDNPLLD